MSMAKRFFTQKTMTEYNQWNYGQNQIYWEKTHISQYSISTNRKFSTGTKTGFF